jgi:argininosuccinate lyase
LKLWDKGQPVDALIEAYTVGDDPELDLRLLPHDVRASKAHAEMLASIGVLTGSERQALVEALDAAEAAWRLGEFRIEREDEDVHTALERFLTERVGEAGKKIHTARSRNDQVLTDLRLWQRDAVAEAEVAVIATVLAFESFAEKHGEIAIPGYTHMQRAMPSSLGRWARAYAELLRTDLPLIHAAGEAASACPLGTAAGYGVPTVMPIDRRATATALGFARVLEPAEAAQPGRGKVEAVFLFAMTQVAVTLGKWAWDVCWYVTEELSLLRLPAALTTGSSLMPQKRNPDVVELTRARAAVVRAALDEVMSISASLPSGYHRDLQLLKAPLFRGVDTAMAMLAITAHVMRSLEPVPERCAAACGPELAATEAALALVRDGVPFRDAYRQVGTRWTKP